MTQVIFLKNIEFSNDSKLLLELANNPLDRLLGTASDFQMPPLLGFFLMPYRVFLFLGLNDYDSLKALLVIYASVAAILFKQTLSAFQIKNQVKIEVIFSIWLISISFFLVQEDVLGTIFIILLVYFLKKDRNVKAGLIIGLGASIGKVFFILLAIPIAFYLINKSGLRNSINYISSFVLSSSSWLIASYKTLKEQKNTIINFELPMYFSSNGWSTLSDLSQYSDSFLRYLSYTCLTLSVIFIVFLSLRERANNIALIGLMGLFILTFSYMVQPEYFYLVLPLFFFLEKTNDFFLLSSLIISVLAQNLMFGLSSITSTTGNTQKIDFLEKLSSKIQFLNLDHLTLITSLLVSIIQIALIVRILSKISNEMHGI